MVIAISMEECPWEIYHHNNLSIVYLDGTCHEYRFYGNGKRCSVFFHSCLALFSPVCTGPSRYSFLSFFCFRKIREAKAAISALVNFVGLVGTNTLMSTNCPSSFVTTAFPCFPNFLDLLSMKIVSSCAAASCH